MTGIRQRRDLAWFAPTSRLGLAAGAALLLIGATPAAAQGMQIETVVIFRHGEKPAMGLGQLDCKGLNRALALPAVLAKQFGTPGALFAPDPADQIMDGDSGPYSYVRPLATIEPTAIALQMPVNTQYGYTAIADLQSAVTQANLAAATVFIAWEHGQIVPFAKALVKQFGGNPGIVPSSWPETDYDTIFVVTITRPGGGQPSVQFSTSAEGLNGESATCPNPAQTSGRRMPARHGIAWHRR